MYSDIMNCLLWRHGGHVYLKADGRIEVPQSIISKMGWQQLDEIYITTEGGEIVLSAEEYFLPDAFTMRCKVSSGRIRIPLTVTKKAGFATASSTTPPVYILIAGEKIVIKSNILVGENEQRIRSFLDTLSRAQQEELTKILKNEPSLRVAPKDVSDSVSSGLPELILPDASQPIVFRIIGLPVSLGDAVWSRGSELVLVEGFGREVRIIPGIQITSGGYRIGFLLVDNPLFHVIADLVKRKKASELIIWYDTSAPENFSVYVNPPTDIGNELFRKAAAICSSPLGFAESTFRSIPRGQYLLKSHEFESLPVLVRQNIVVRS